MKKLFALCICLTLICGSAALADGTSQRDPMTFGKAIILTPVELPGSAEGRMPCSVSPDGGTILWRERDGSLLLTRDGAEIPVHAAPERGDGDPYGKLEYGLSKLSSSFPGDEGVSWSPDGKYFIFCDRSRTVASMVPTEIDLILVDAENGEAFALLPWRDGFSEEGSKVEVESDEFDRVIEARFDSTGENIWLICYLMNSPGGYYLLVRYNLAEHRAELIDNDFGLSTNQQYLFEDGSGSFMVMSGSSLGFNGDAHDVVTRYRPSLSWLFRTNDGGLTSERFERDVIQDALRRQKGSVSPATGYGLILVCGPARTISSGADTNTALAQARFAAPVTLPRLNRITPDGIDLNRYWELAGDPKDPSSLRLTETDPDLVGLIKARYSDGRALTKDEQTRLDNYAESILLNDLPVLSCLSMSPDGHYAILSARRRYEGTALFWLLDVETMAMRPVEAPDSLMSDYFGTEMGFGYRPGMEWSRSGILLIFNSGSETVEAYRLDVRE